MTLILVLLVLGAILMFLETLLPGLVTGMLGFLCWVAAVILSYRDFGFQTGNLVLGGVLLGRAGRVHQSRDRRGPASRRARGVT